MAAPRTEEQSILRAARTATVAALRCSDVCAIHTQDCAEAIKLCVTMFSGRVCKRVGVDVRLKRLCATAIVRADRAVGARQTHLIGTTGTRSSMGRRV